MQARFNYPTRVLFGESILEQLPEELYSHGILHPLLVTDQGLMKTAVPQRVFELLQRAGINYSVYSAVVSNPTATHVEEGTGVFHQVKADGLIALGGGSAMDTARGIQILAHHPGPLEKYDDLVGGDALITGKVPPCVAIPTTAGTGSEVSRSAVITIPAVERKVVLFSPRLMPAVAICDPELTYSLPSRITAETGMDALSHSVEAYLSPGLHPMADAIALEAIGFVGRFLERAVEDGQDIEARRYMMLASTMGAVAFQKGLGVNHSLAHPLSSVCALSHGLANAIMLPHTLRFNGEVVPERVESVAIALGCDEVSVEGVASVLEQLSVRMKLPTRLSEMGVGEEHLDLLVEKAMEDGCYSTNPRPVNAAEFRALFVGAL